MAFQYFFSLLEIMRVGFTTMANYYTDHPEIDSISNTFDEKDLWTQGTHFADKDQLMSPVNYVDAKRKLQDCSNHGLSANIIEPNSVSVDLEGPHLEKGRMIYAARPSRY
jgi:hypothetical protein